MTRATMRGLAIGCAVLIVSLGASGESLQVARGIKSFKLPNGLQLVVAVRPELQLAAVNLTVNIGAIDDPPGRSGMAHILEHVTLSGSTTVGTLDPVAEASALAELDRAHEALLRESQRAEPEPAILVGLERWVEQAQQAATRACETGEILGGRLEAHGAVGLNATTSADVTQFFTSIPNEQIELWISLEAERLQHPILRRFYSERNVILREIAGLTGGKPTLQERLLQKIFPGGSVSQPMEGTPEQINTIDRPEAFAYFRRFYRPENIVIAVVGNVDPETVYRLVARYFAGWHSDGIAELPRSQREEATPPTKPVVQTFRSGNSPVVFFAFPEARRQTPAQAAGLEAVAELINSTELSPLRRKLIKEQRAAWSVAATSHYPARKQAAIFLLHVYGTAGTESQDLIRESSTLLKSLENIPGEDLTGAALGAEMRIASQLDDPPTLASLLGLYQAVDGDWSVPFRRLEAVRSLGAEGVRAAAHQLLDTLPSADLSTGAR